MSEILQVTAAILEKDGRVMIAQRRAGDSLARKWEFPGGKVKTGETPEQCLARELTEEFDIRVLVGEFLGSRFQQYDHAAIELLVYRVRWVGGVPVAQAHADFRWAAPGELKNYEFAPADIPFVRKLETGEIDLRSKPATR